MAALAAWIVWRLLPSDDKAIRKSMLRLVQAASVKPNESGFTRLAYADRLAAFFTTNATLHLEGLSADVPLIATRTDLLQAATAARVYLRQAQFELADLNIKFPAERQVANVYMVVTGQINGETNRFGQPFRVVLRKTNGRWLIEEMTTLENQ